MLKSMGSQRVGHDSATEHRLESTHKISYTLGPRVKANLMGAWARPPAGRGECTGQWGPAVAHLGT